MSTSEESRRFIRWLVIGTIVILGAVGVNKFALTVTKLDVKIDPPRLFPDGKSSVVVRLVPLNALGLETPFVAAKIRYEVEEGGDKVRIVYAPDSSSITIFAKYETGNVSLLLHTPIFPLPVTVSIPIEQMLADGDGDGYPDAAELTSEEDRRNFARWFASIAESQYYRTDPEWRREDRDCAGLIRFAGREALKRHTTEWFRKRSYLADANIPDVKKFNYPDIPILREKLFRIAPGAFSPKDTAARSSAFGSFAEARLLKDHTFFF